MNCTILQTILNQYDPPGQIMVFLGVVMILINVISSMVWMAMYYDNIFYTIIGSSVVFMNVMLMIGIVYHRREFLIIFLWYTVYTLSKFQDFSVIQIFRETNLGESKSSKTVVFCHFRGFEFC